MAQAGLPVPTTLALSTNPLAGGCEGGRVRLVLVEGEGETLREGVEGAIRKFLESEDMRRYNMV